MASPKKTPRKPKAKTEYLEGPQAADRFKRAMQAILRPHCPASIASASKAR